jgi:ADP-ribose pyrophosphatase YjhB (NUDIX family)
MSGPEVPASDRRFCRLAQGRSRFEGYWELPDDGFCLSSFVLLSPKSGRERVLLGHLDPNAPWGEIGALDPKRIHLNATGWMLPSSHLLHFESPEQAAQRVLAEQLGLEEVALEAPMIFSEKYRPARHPERGDHWDLEFLFRGRLASDAEVRHRAWKELRWLDPATTPRKEFTRSHDEILENAGYRVGA